MVAGTQLLPHFCAIETLFPLVVIGELLAFVLVLKPDGQPVGFFRDLALDYIARQTMNTSDFLDGLLRMLALYAPQVRHVTHNLISSHDTERFLTMCGGQKAGLARFRLAMLLLLTLPGAPGIYYGDEIGMGDNIYLGDRNGVRTPMQWSMDRNGGFSKADSARLYLPLIMDPVYGYQSVNVEAQERDPSSMLHFMITASTLEVCR